MLRGTKRRGSYFLLRSPARLAVLGIRQFAFVIGSGALKQRTSIIEQCRWIVLQFSAVGVRASR